MADFGDFFGDVAQAAAVTSQAASVMSGPLNTVARISGNRSIGDAAQMVNLGGAAAGNLASGITNLSNINGNIFDPSNARLAMAGLSQLSAAASMGSALVDMINGDSSQTEVSYQRGYGNIPGGGGYGSGGGGGSGGPGGRGGSQASSSKPSSGSGGHNVPWSVSLDCPALSGKVIFPVTPQITMTDTAKYSSAGLVHANYAMQFYESSEVSAVQIMADFPVQNAQQAQELLNCIYMFRAATKMFWGSDAAAGTPPPLCFLNGYGRGYMQNVPCVVTSFSHTMPEDKDYIYANGTRVPTMSQVQLQLQPVYSRNSLNSLSIAAVASGGLLNFI